MCVLETGFEIDIGIVRIASKCLLYVQAISIGTDFDGIKFRRFIAASFAIGSMGMT